MKSIIFTLMFLSVNVFARPQVKNKALGVTESFGPILSTQVLKTGGVHVQGLMLSGDKARIGRPSFEYYAEKIELIFTDGTKEIVLVKSWFHRSVSLNVSFDKNVDKILISARHDDYHQSSYSHRLAVYTF